MNCIVGIYKKLNNCTKITNINMVSDMSISKSFRYVIVNNNNNKNKTLV